MVQPQGLITALDVGSSKVAALIAQPSEDGLMVLGTGHRESRGVRRGYIADMVATESAVREAVEQAEKIARTTIDEAWLSFSAGGLFSDVAAVEVALEGERITPAHVDDLLDAGRRSIDPDGRTVLHAQPALYTIDGLKGVKNPLGLYAERLGVDIHVVVAEPSPIRNLDHCVRSAHLAVKQIVASPVATAMSCLSEEERELGVALVELGAEVTNISLIAGGLLVGLASVGLGAADITDDIASAFGTRRAQAERMKCFHGSAQTSPRDNHDMIEVAPLSGEQGAAAEPARITRAQLIAVIRQRLEQIFGAIDESLKSLGFVGPIARQVVLTGGGAELKGIADYAQAMLGRSVRIGRPRGLIGLPEAHSGPAFATLAGLVQFAASNPIDLRPNPSPQTVIRISPANFLQRMAQAFKSGF